MSKKKSSEGVAAIKAGERSVSYSDALITSLTDGVVSLDKDNNIVEWNSGAEALFGYTKSEVLGQNVDGLIGGEKQAEAKSITDDTLIEGQKIFIPETVRFRKDGSSVQVSISSSPILQEGKRIGAVAVYRDISELAAARSQAQLANEAKSEFLANMSHEIRTPMNGIIGMTELALSTELTEEQQDYLESIKQSADSLISIINDVLDFSKIEAKKIEISSIHFDLNEALGDMVSALALHAHQKGLELAYEVSPDVPQRVIGDPGRLRQILINLISNAIKFTPKGEVFVSLREEERTEDETLLLFTVKDTGVGIPEEKQEHIFDAFTQADSTMTREFGGTGLGLAITARLVELMGGKISVQSQPGKGSQFGFTVRLGIQKGPKKTLIPAELKDVEGLSVLIVDDNQTNRAILDRMLRNWKLETTAVASGEEALAVLNETEKKGKDISLIILDAHMPRMDGFSLADRIQRTPGLTHPTIMMLTSAGVRGDAARCKSLGISAYLTKPIKQADLLNSIMYVLSGDRKNQEKEAPLITKYVIKESRQHFRILVAEDNIINQKMAENILTKRGHSVVLACDGREALACLDKEDFDLILMDVQMPGIDGFEATSRIREQEKNSGFYTPILAMTAHAMKGDREKCLEAGMDDYVAKPINPKDLIQTIERVLKQSKRRLNKRISDSP